MRIAYSLLLAGLFILGYFLCRSFICPTDGAVNGAAKSSMLGAAASKDQCVVNLNFNDRDLDVVSTENFRFARNSAELLEPSESLNKSLDKVVDYLNDHSGRAMTINGYYQENEDFDSELDELENLGVARANMVKAYFEVLGAEGDQIQTAGVETIDACFRGDTLLMKGVDVKFGALTD